MKTYSYSLGKLYPHNGENYSGEFPSREEALQAGLSDVRRKKFAGTIFTAKNIPKTILDYFDPEKFLEYLEELAYDDVGEVADGWLLPPRPLKLKQDILDDLSGAITEWATKHNLQPRFWGVTEIEEYITAI